MELRSTEGIHQAGDLSRRMRGDKNHEIIICRGNHDWIDGLTIHESGDEGAMVRKEDEGFDGRERHL